jgi:hypothetical protein
MAEEVKEPSFVIEEEIPTEEGFAIEEPTEEQVEEKVEETTEETTSEETKEEVVEEVKEDQKTEEITSEEKTEEEITSEETKEEQPEVDKFALVDEAITESSDGQFKSFNEYVDAYNELAGFKEKIESDEFLKGVFDYYEQTGDLTPYLEAKTVDFEKLSDIDILRRDFKEQNPYLSEDMLNRKFNRNVLSVINKQIDKEEMESSEIEDIELEKAELKAKAEHLKKEYIEKQKNFKAPERKPESSLNEEQEQMAMRYDKWRKEYFEKEVEEFKPLGEGKIVIPIGDKAEDAFNYELPDQKAIKAAALNENILFDFIRVKDAKGQNVNFSDTGLTKIDVSKLIKLATYASDMEGFEKALINHGKSLGTETIAEEIKNTTEKEDKSRGEEDLTEKTGFEVEGEFNG